jgi:hypothetical protein
LFTQFASPMSSLSLKYSQVPIRWFMEPCRPGSQSRYRGRDCQEDSVMVYIPEHQRDYVWKLPKQQELIHSVFKGYPIPAIMATQDERNRYSIQDGQQRLETLWRFYTDTFPIKRDNESKFFKDLSDVEKKIFLDYQIPLIDITGANDDQESEIYDLMNQGMSLSHGEKFWNRRSKPLVRLTEELMLTRGSGLNGSMVDVFGDYLSATDLRHNNISNAIAYIAGAAFGPEYITTSYQKLAKKVNDAEPIDRTTVMRRLEEVFRIYRDADETQAVGNAKKRKSQWKIGLYSGYILYSYLQHEDDTLSWTAVRNTWIEFLIRVRRNPAIAYTTLYKGMPSIQANLCVEKLKRGYENILDLQVHGFEQALAQVVEEENDNYDYDSE